LLIFSLFFRYAESKKNPWLSILRFLVTMLCFCYYSIIMKLQDNKNDDRMLRARSSSARSGQSSMRTTSPFLLPLIRRPLGVKGGETNNAR